MKTGVVTIYDVPNYGSVLQAYATQQILAAIGCEPVFIEYDRSNKWYVEHAHIKESSSLRKIVRKLGLMPDHRKVLRLEAFKKKYFKKSRVFKDLDDLRSEKWADFEAFVVGSDQVWNPRYLAGDSVFMLSFAPDRVKKISIASSFASSELPDEYVAKYRNYLSRFDAISVREANGVKIVKDQLKLPVEPRLLLDPTLLLSASQWNECLRGKQKPKRKYILVYMLSYAFEPRPYIYDVIRHFKNETGFEVLALDGYSKSAPKDLRMQDKCDTGIPGFISLFANAELVITSSFHGTAFAVNYCRPVVSIMPQGGDDRQLSLLKTLDVPHCAVRIGTPVEGLNPYYDAAQVKQRLQDIREENINWIRTLMAR